MTTKHPVDVLIETVRTNVVGFEVDGIRVLDAEFSTCQLPEYWDRDSLVVKLILTDPHDGGPGWPRATRNAIEDHARSYLRAADTTGVLPLLHFGAEHPNYGYGRVSR